MPFPARGARSEAQGVGDVTAGSDVTSVAGCHGGGEGGRGGCGGTGQPTSATGAEVVGVVVDGEGDVCGNVGLVVGAGCAGGECVAPATRSGFFAGAGGGEPDVAASVATDATMPKTRMAAANHHGFRPLDKGTDSILASYLHVRGAPGTGVRRSGSPSSNTKLTPRPSSWRGVPRATRRVKRALPSLRADDADRCLRDRGTRAGDGRRRYRRGRRTR